MYSRFLKETAELYHGKEVQDTSEKIAQSANLWTETANLILGSSQKEKLEEIKERLIEARSKITECARIEEEAFGILLAS